MSTPRDLAELWLLPVWTEENACAAIGWTIEELRVQRYRHGLPYTKSGKQVLISRDSFVAWVKQRECARPDSESLVSTPTTKDRDE